MNNRSYRCLRTAGLLLCLYFSGPGAKAQINFPLPAHAPMGNITALEYFFDTDPGMGNGMNISIVPGADITATPNIDISGLNPGIHRLYLRARSGDSWGQTNAQLCYIIPQTNLPFSAVVPVTRMEYAFDTDPGFWNATPMPVTSGLDITTLSNINISSLANGVHYFFLRAGDGNGWGQTNVLAFQVVSLGNIHAPNLRAPITRLEYFTDTDPGPGNGHSILVPADTDVTANNFIADISGLAPGVHNFYVRAQDIAGSWSLLNNMKLSLVVVNISIPAAAAVQDIHRLEYYFDTDPGIGNGTPVPLTPTQDLSNFNIIADISGMSIGTHTLYIRSAGTQWSLTNTQTFRVGSSLPVKLLTFNARREDDQVLLQWQTAQETDHDHFVIERSSNALSFDSIGHKPGRNSSRNEDYEYMDEHPLAGISYYRLKQVSKNGSTTYSPVVAVRMDQGAILFTANNPVTDLLTIRTTAQKLELQLSDMTGREIRRLTVSGPADHRIDIHALPSGEYLLTGQMQEQKQQLKLIKY